MRFLSILGTAASLLACYVNAQNLPLAITYPLGGTLQAGSQITIRWTPTTAATVMLQLRYGSNAGNLAIGTPIASGVANSGSYSWTVPSDLASTQYAIQITDSSAVTNYSPSFQVAGGTGALSTASTALPSTTSTTTAATTSSSATKSSASGSSSSSSSSASKSASSSSSSSASSSSTSATNAPSTGGAEQMKGGSFAAILGIGAMVVMA